MNRQINIALLLIFCISILAGQDFENQLSMQYNQKIAYKKEVYDRTLETIRDNPTSEELDQLYFNLAELSTEIDQLEPQKTATYYKQVLVYNRSFLYKDMVLYNIGYFQEKAIVLANGQQRQNYEDFGTTIPDSLKYSEKMFKPATDYYRRLQDEHPLSTYYDETTWRLAELYYKIGIESKSTVALMRAKDNFSLMNEKIDSPYFYQCSIGFAWTQYELGEYTSAMNSCFAMLNGFAENPSAFNWQILTDEAVTIIAWILVNDDNIDFLDSNIATAQIELRLRELAPVWKKKVIFDIGELFLLNDQPRIAIGIFEAYLTLYPDTENAPEIDAAIIDIYLQYPDLFGGETNVNNIIEQRHAQMLINYNPQSSWYEQNKTLDIFNSVDIIRTLIEYQEPDFYNDFLEIPNRSKYLDYRDMINSYSGFTEFPSLKTSKSEKLFHRNLVYMSQMLAQSSDSVADYEYAIKDLENFNNAYPDHADYIDFAMNIFFCYEKIYSSETAVTSQIADSDTLYISASLQYENILRQDAENHQDELARVIFKRAEYHYIADNLEEALIDYAAITILDTDNELITDSWRRMAEIHLKQDDFDSAETEFRQAMTIAEGFTQSVIFDNILAAIQKKAEFLLSQNKPDAAAAEFLRLAAELEAVYPDKSLQFFSMAIDVYEELGNDNKVNELLAMNSGRQSLDQAIALYSNTWMEADRLKDWNRSIALRKNFIKIYENTNEAFRTRLQIIDIYENELDDPGKAAQLYMELFEDSENYDLRSQKRENIFLNAMRIYQNIGNKSKSVELTQSFIQSFPDYSLIDLNLTYSDSDNYRTNVRKLQKLKDNINALFLAENYEIMSVEITSFQEISTALNADSLMLDLARDNARFDRLLEYADFFARYKAALGNIENNFLLDNAQKLLPVDNSTLWQENMVAGENRIGKLLDQCNQLRNTIMVLLQEGKNYQLETAIYTHSIWAIAAVYDHAYEAVDQQVRNFVVKSDQLNRPELIDNKYLQSELKRKVITEGNEYSFEFKLAAANFYQNLLYNYFDGEEYADLWTRKALTRLSEWGIREISGDIVKLDETMLLAEESYANEEIEQEYNNIYSDYQAKRYALAQDQFMNFISSYPGHTLTYNALYYSGESYYNMGQLSKARDIFEQVIDFDRDKTPDALMRLGHYYNSVGNRRQAYEYWNRLVNEYPDHYLAQIVTLTISQIDEQELLVSQLSEKDVSDERKIELRYRKSVQNFKKGKYKAARKEFEKFNRNYPDHELAYISLFMQAESLFNEDKYNQAIAIYEKVIALNGNKSALSIYRAGLCAEKTGNNAKRDDFWLDLINGYPDHYLVKQITAGNIDLKLKIPASAISHSKIPAKAISQKVKPADPAQDIYKSALVEFRYQNYSEALALLEKFIAENPQHRLLYNARYLSAEAYQYTGNNTLSLKFFEELLPQAGARRAETQLHIAENLIALGNYETAISVLNTVAINYAGTFSAAQANKLIKQISVGVNNEE